MNLQLSLVEVGLYLPAEVFREDHADGFGEDGLEEIEVRGKVTRVEERPGDDAEVAAEVLLVAGAETERRVEAEDPRFLEIPEDALESGNEVVDIVVGEVLEGKDVGKDAHDLSEQPERDERSDPVSRTDPCDIPLVACRLLSREGIPVILPVAFREAS